MTMVMEISPVSKATFKARALEIMRRVEATGSPVIVTDRGRPVLRLTPYRGEDDALLASLRGTVVSYAEPMEPAATGEWQALGDPAASASERTLAPGAPHPEARVVGERTERLLLDTHAWVWWLNGSAELPSGLAQAIHSARAQARLWVSSISVWEVALLVRRRRLTLSIPVPAWLTSAEALAGVRFLPVDSGIAARAVELADLHGDPADRIIVASAERLGATLITNDERLLAHDAVPARWGNDEEM